MRLRQASQAEIPLLTEMMRVFYSEKTHAGLFPVQAVPGAVERALSLAGQGVHTLLVLREPDAEPVGYMIGSSVYSNEYQGFMFFLDEFMIQPQSRGAGQGAAALKALEVWTREHGFVGVGLETTRENVAARRFYRRNGFEESDRVHMRALWDAAAQ